MKIVILIGMCMLFLVSGCYYPSSDCEKTEYEKCIINCEEPFNCKLNKYGWNIDCDGDKQVEEILEYCSQKCTNMNGM